MSRRPGKLVMGKLYFHRSALSLMDASVRKKVATAQSAVPDWEWDIARVHKSADQVALIKSPDWDTADEPLVGEMVIVAEGAVRRRAAMGQIYHHKWCFVADDYHGFDIEASKARSVAWESLDPPVNKSKIGWLRYWKAEVLPRLSA